MAEITESVKSHMILTDENIVKAEYLRNSVKSYLHQVVLSRKKDMSETDESKLAASMRSIITSELKPIMERVDQYFQD